MVGPDFPQASHYIAARAHSCLGHSCVVRSLAYLCVWEIKTESMPSGGPFFLRVKFPKAHKYRQLVSRQKNIQILSSIPTQLSPVPVDVT
jgi:hypothetical protein